MARTGSRRYFEYTSDNGLGYQVALDESNAEIPNFGFTGISAQTRASGRFLKVSATRPIEMRYILCVGVDEANKDARRKLYVGSTDAAAWTGVGTNITIDGESYAVTAYVGEKRFVIPTVDTEQLDGDADSNLAAVAP